MDGQIFWNGLVLFAVQTSKCKKFGVYIMGEDESSKNEMDDVCELILRGGVIENVPGDTPEAVYLNAVKRFELPEYLSQAEFYTELVSRERILSTAVGTGVAIPHPRRTLLRSDQDQKIYVVYPSEAQDMNAPDSRSVYVMFILLTYTPKFHLQVLSGLAKSLQSVKFQGILESKPTKEVLVEALKKYSD